MVEQEELRDLLQVVLQEAPVAEEVGMQEEQEESKRVMGV